MIRKALLKAILPVTSILVLLLVWEGIVVVFHVQPYVAPRPLAAIQAVTDNWGALWPLVLQIVRETLLGFVGGALIGIFFGVVMSKVRFIQKILYPQLIVSQAVPVIAIAFPLTAILGFGSSKPIIVIVIWIVFFPVTVNVLDGLSHVDQDLLNLAKVYGATRWRTFWQIEVPATVTPLFSGLKIGATYAITGAFIGELVSPAGSSLAQYVNHADGYLNQAAVFGVTLLLATIGVAFFLTVTWAEVIATPWQRRSVTRRSWRRRIATSRSDG
jgi:ABC-type nitrate/sulfonate/bicarbonate transport system permease component